MVVKHLKSNRRFIFSNLAKKMLRKLLFPLIFIIGCSFNFAQTTYEIHTIGFYNLENLFDIKDDSLTLDEISPIMEIEYNRENIYRQKINNMAKVISQIGRAKTNIAPTIIGVAEIENHNVLKDLLSSPHLKNEAYNYIHYDSPDRRGIDVALLYNSNFFSPIQHEVFELKLWNEEGYPIYTRDQLLVSGYLQNELIHIIVNHWPSRRGGTARSSFKREKAAYLNVQIIEKLRKNDPNAKIIIMGDLNDDPIDKSIKSVLLNSENFPDNNLYNPSEELFKNGENTLVYRDQLNMFDQIILSKSLLNKDKKKDLNDFKLYKAGVFKPNYLITSKGKYKGYPFRSFAGAHYTGGYSDHYPVYIYVIRNLLRN